MKIKNILTFFTSFTVFCFSAFSQVITPIQTSFGFAADTAGLMESDVETLFQNHGADDYSSLVFTTDYFSNGQFYTDSDPLFDNPFVTLGSDLYFTEMQVNPEEFLFSGFASISFFGNESGDRNKLFLNEYDLGGNVVNTNELLFDYKSTASNSVTPAPTTYEFQGSGNALYSFSHLNPAKGAAFQESEDRFKFFIGYDPITQLSTGDWIIAIDDREETLVDYDDGFFYLVNDGSPITPVPEPSTVGFIAAASLVGFIFLNNRRKRNKKVCLM